MKNKGFTLIELLAVIVILAIIALIAVPIVLSIINNSKKESQERSIELYAGAVKNAVARYQINNPSDNVEGEFTQTNKGATLNGNVNLSIEYDGEVECDTIEIYSNGTVYLAECKVDGKEVEYTYGTKQELASTQESKMYYTWDLFGYVGTTSAPESPSTTPPEGKKVYLGYNVNDSTGVVSEAFVCFVKEGKEYCLKSYDTTAYADNQDVIRDAYSEIADTNTCFIADSEFSCDADGLGAFATSNGTVIVCNGGFGCYVDGRGPGCNVTSTGFFGCYE